jgi:hypothetical protein
MLKTTRIRAEANAMPACGKLCIVRTFELVRVNRLTQVKIGQGEGDTK